MFCVRQEVSVKCYLDALQAYDSFYLPSNFICHIFFFRSFPC